MFVDKEDTESDTDVEEASDEDDNDVDNTEGLGEAEILEKAYNAEIKEDSESEVESNEESDEENIKKRKEKVQYRF